MTWTITIEARWSLSCAPSLENIGGDRYDHERHSALVVRLGVAGFLGLLTYSAVHSMDYAEEAAYNRDLRRVQAVTAELNERVLKSRSALMTQYDPLVRALHDLRELHERLKRVPEFLGDDAAFDLRAQLDESEAQLRQKDELVESFKTHNSVLQNSLHYFPVLANSVIDRARVAPTALTSRPASRL